MARVIANPYARHTHSCGATVEFDLADISLEQLPTLKNPGETHVTCPACGKTFHTARLRWRTPKVGNLK